jgi:transposase
MERRRADMLPEEEREQIRRAYHIEKKSIRQIARETGHCREAIRNSLVSGSPKHYQLAAAKPGPVFQPFQVRVEELLAQNDSLPRKQQYTSHKIFEIIQSEGYLGCESRVRQYIAQWRATHSQREAFLPLAFDPGKDAQVDWGEAVAVIAGVRQTIQIFVMRLCYSRRTFVMAFPSQKQESFFFGHVQAFKHFGGVPSRISYDNLATAVKLTMKKGRKRYENRTFVTFRSHYLFESHFCTPAQGHEKGGVEHGVGFVRRNYLVPIPEVASFDDLNRHLLDHCLKDDLRRVQRQAITIGEAWQQEQPYLQALPAFEYDCCEVTVVQINPYSQACFESNRYSVPVDRTCREVTVKAYPFHVDIFDKATLLARHPRSYEREQDIFDPLHYLPLLEQRPRAFDYAAPLRHWRKDWPPSYHQMLQQLREKWPEGRGVQEFVRILQLHKEYSASLMAQAIEQALSYGCVHLDGVLHCLHQLLEQEAHQAPLDLSDHPQLDAIGTQPIDLSRYELLLKQSW